MIVIKDSNRLNKEAAQLLAEATKPNEVIKSYPKVSFDNYAGQHLTIVDLKADGHFQNIMNSEYFANTLVNEWHMPNTIKVINLLIADVPSKYQDDGIDVFASELSQLLKDKYQHEVEVRVINDFKSTYTLLVPPQYSTTSQEWEVFGLDSEDIPRKKPAFNFNFDNLLELIKNKKIQPTWHGKDLGKWLSKKEQAYTAWNPSPTLSR